MMKSEKILIVLHNSDVAPRFDLAAEVLIIENAETPETAQKRLVVLPRASADALCNLIINEGVRTVICGGIEEDYFQYLAWKRIGVIDSVIGSSQAALERWFEGALQPGAIL